MPKKENISNNIYVKNKTEHNNAPKSSVNRLKRFLTAEEFFVFQDMEQIRPTHNVTAANTLRMETQIDRSSLHNDFLIYQNARQLPLTETASQQDMGIVLFCLKGRAILQVHETESRLNQSDLVVLLPGQLVALKKTSPDFIVNYFAYSRPLLNDVLCGIYRLPPHFYLHMHNHFLYPLDEESTISFGHYFRMLYKRAKTDRIYKRTLIINLLRILFMDLYEDYRTQTHIRETTADSRKEELAHNFFQMIMESHPVDHQVSHYAEKLYISPKHLSTVIKQVSGKSAKEWITDYIILEIKSLLNNTDLEIQEIASQTHFSNQSALCRFFRKHTGISPSTYRSMK